MDSERQLSLSNQENVTKHGERVNENCCTSFPVLPYARRSTLNADKLEATEPHPAPDGPLALAARGEADVVLAIDVDGQAERKPLDAPRCELELIWREGNPSSFDGKLYNESNLTSNGQKSLEDLEDVGAARLLHHADLVDLRLLLLLPLLLLMLLAPPPASSRASATLQLGPL